MDSNVIKQSKSQKRNDLILIFCLIMIALLSYVFLRSKKNSGQRVQIIHHRQILFDLPLAKDTVKLIQDDDQYNRIVIKDGQVWIDSANCHNQICVHHAKIEYSGQSIVCLPHQLIVQISGESEQSHPVDAFSY